MEEMARKRMGVVQTFRKAQTIQKVNFVVRNNNNSNNNNNNNNNNWTQLKPTFNQFFTPIPPETSGFLMFSGGAEMEHWLKLS